MNSAAEKYYYRGTNDENDAADAECKAIATTEEVTGVIEKAFKNDRELMVRLVGYALKNMYLYFYSPCVEGNTAADITQTVLKKIITGKRKWNKQKIPEISRFLFVAVLSEIRNMRKKKDYLPTEDCYDAEGHFIEEYFKDDAADDLENNRVALDVHAVIEKIKMELESDEVAYFVFEELLNEYNNNNNTNQNIGIAKNLGITVKEVENALKRIRTRAIKSIKPKK